ncbi:uncharacterized protein LOC112566500 [Pomacea canaliculata]|uniref:uncharacterized protein LOC112566500 n=1 Tax=Pomacea canaliculata TaxID=400727 RepID=UPI000D7297FB|nr:uncharacterized protein LOC112566500 [Pomacea canaliculata]XP_025098505.1 uncharacterized protein LOC112566500 [Pomacea canaliculata]
MRGGFILLFLASVAFVGGRAAFTCLSEFGNRLVQFNGYRARVELPCKYNAIKGQQCGDYIINVTPGITFNGVDYLSATAWLGVKRISDGKFIEFRTSYKIAGKYLTELQCEGSTTLLPIVKKDGNLEFTDIFNYTPEDDGLGVIFTEKQNTWSFSFGLYEFKGSKFKSSDWSFTCNDDSVPLVPYPEQLCGNTTKSVLKDRTAGFTQWSDDVATITYDVFRNPKITQYEKIEDFCQVSQDKLVNLCPDDAAREKTIAACWRILGEKGHRKCLSKYTFSPIEIFANCIDWMCQGAPPKDPTKSCDKVAEAIDDCREFPGLTSLVKESKCYSGLSYRLKDDSEGDSCP